jgi:hypothetical protein
MHGSKNGRVRLADRPADYKRLGIAPIEFAEFEDGQRISTERGHYEWWYFDAHLDDGATVVVVFYTKPNVSPSGPLAPRITINITLLTVAASTGFSIPPRRCSAHRNLSATLDWDEPLRRRSQSLPHHGNDRGNIGRHRIDRQVRAWRPKSGHLYFGAEGPGKLFA